MVFSVHTELEEHRCTATVKTLNSDNERERFREKFLRIEEKQSLVYTRTRAVLSAVSAVTE